MNLEARSDKGKRPANTVATQVSPNGSVQRRWAVRRLMRGRVTLYQMKIGGGIAASIESETSMPRSAVGYPAQMLVMTPSSNIGRDNAMRESTK